MTDLSSTKQLIAVLNSPKPADAFIHSAQAVEQGMQGNAYFTESAVAVTKLSADIKTLIEAQRVCVLNPLPQLTQARNSARVVVENGLRDLRLDVQKVANKNPTIAADIIKGAGMFVKILSIRGKQRNAIEDGIEPGTVELTAEGAGMHSWRYSLDGEVWILESPSSDSTTTITGLTPGLVYYFQNQGILRNKQRTEWSQSLKHRVR